MADPAWDDESVEQLIGCVRRNDVSVASKLVGSHRPLYSFELKELRFWPVHEASAGGNAELVKLLLSRDFEVEAPDLDGFTPLHRAAEAGQLETARVLVAAGARVDLVSALAGGYRLTPLMLACERGDVAMVKYLLSAGARADAQVQALPSSADQDDGALQPDEEQELLETMDEASVSLTPLHSALRAPVDEAVLGPLVTLLLEAGANVNAPDAEGNGPLHLAAQRGAAGLVRALLARGADPAHKNLRGELPEVGTPALAISADLEQARAGKPLPTGTATPMTARKKSRSEGRAKRGRPTAMHRAISDNESSSKLRELAKRGVALDALDGAGQAALHLAVLTQLARFVEVLAELGADVNVQDGEGMTPLHLAASLHYLRPARALLQAGARVNALDSFGRTPLHLAARGGPWDISKLLLEHGADPTIQDKQGATPADVATDEDTRKAIREFVRRTPR